MGILQIKAVLTIPRWCLDTVQLDKRKHGPHFQIRLQSAFKGGYAHLPDPLCMPSSVRNPIW